jgi:hypothetical protein
MMRNCMQRNKIAELVLGAPRETAEMANPQGSLRDPAPDTPISFLPNTAFLSRNHAHCCGGMNYVGPSALTVLYSLFPGAMPQAGIDPGRWPSIQECKRQKKTIETNVFS